MTLRFDGAAAERLRQLLASRPADELEMPELRRACVVIPLVRRGDDWALIFMRRSDEMRVHKGQVAFPGGAVEEGESLEEAALREMEEEIGVDRAGVALIGRLDDVITRTGFLVAPFVGIVPAVAAYQLAAAEVTEVFEVPVSALLEAGNPEVRYISYAADRYPIYFYKHDGREIWGLTGRILKSFLDLLRLSL